MHSPKHPEQKEGRCNARSRDGGYCWSWPTRVHGRRCRMHGGSKTSGRPCIHGRYSQAMRAELKDQYRTLLEDQSESTDLADELAAIRALICEYLARFPDGIAMGGDDVGRLVGWLGDVSKVANRASMIEARGALTSRQVALLETVIVRLLAEFLGPEQREAFARRLSEALGSLPMLLLSDSDAEE